MATENLQAHVLQTLKSDFGVAELGGDEPIALTPYLALSCALLYMMASDGVLDAVESSQLQAVLGGDEAVLRYGLRYVQSVPVDQFFMTAPELLSTKDKWCILTNVCDALLSDGHADRAELTLFARMIQAFGLRETQFEPYFKILALKNDKSVLGRYTGVKAERQPMTPHFALAISLLYMLTADGAIGKQEIGQLETVIGEFEGLQNVALAYVRSVKLKQFLDEASALLKPEQKLYILTNVCDSMMSDGELAKLEDMLFVSMLTAFGFSEKSFARYWQVLEVKNFKPFDTRGFKNSVNHDRLMMSEDADGVTFTNELAHGSVGGVPNDAADDSVMSQFIARTMQDNLQSVSDDFENQNNVIKVGLNATDGLNYQKISGEASTDNLQIIEAQASGWQRETLDPVVRAQNIFQVVDAVNRRLERFEVDNFHFLQMGRAQKFTDDFVLAEASYARLGIHLSSAAPLAAQGVVDSEDGGDARDATASEPHRAQRKGDVRLLRDGNAFWQARGRGFAFVQILVATATLAFAGPISTQTTLGRSVAGPLVVVPVFEVSATQPISR